MVDDDNPIYYKNFIDMMVDDDKDIVSGVVRLRNNQKNLNICSAKKVDGLDKYINYKTNPKQDLIQIANCGCGVVCIKRKVVDKLLEAYPRPFENKMTYYIKTKD